MKYFNKETIIIGTISGIIGVVIKGIIDNKAIKEAEKTIDDIGETMNEAHNRVEHLQSIMDQLEVEINDFIKENEELRKENKSLIEEINTYETKFSEIARKELEEREKQEKIEKAKEAIKNKKWDNVYKLTERWYNHYPVQMSRSEVFTNLEKDGYITQEERTEAYNYFGSLWNYVGD